MENAPRAVLSVFAHLHIAVAVKSLVFMMVEISRVNVSLAQDFLPWSRFVKHSALFSRLVEGKFTKFNCS